MRIVSEIAADARLATRMLRRQPWSTLAIAVTLALGIGSTTAIYAVFNDVLFRPAPGVPSEARLITVTFETKGRTASAYGRRAVLPMLREAASGAGLERLGSGCCAGQLAVAAPSGSAPALEQTDFVTSQFFDALGVRVRIGRLLTDDEAESGDSPVAVISEGLWRERFAGAAEVLGQTIDVNGHPFVIVGVTDRFRGWHQSGTTQDGQTDVWLPMGSQ